MFIVTDFDPRYPEILKEVFGEKLVHQYCLMHLDKLIVSDFPRRRRNKENLPFHSLEKSKINFEELMKQIRTYEEVI